MPDLLLELFSEEIPARMQSQAAADLKRLACDALALSGLPFDGAAAFSTPRRLTLHVAGLPARQPDLREVKRGPRVGAPEAAVQGFLKSVGLASIDQAQIEQDPKGKGAFHIAVVERKGRPAIEVLAEILPPILSQFPWPKSMRWGAASARSDALRWVRPLHSIVATFGAETEEPEIVDFTLGGLRAGDMSAGHRFMAPAAFRVRRFDDYVEKLRQAKVMLDPARRRDAILHDARNLALAQGLDLTPDEALLDEVAGLVEWPVVLMGSFDPAFLAIPAEAIRATIRQNQKCFVLRAPNGELANKFILVSNIEASDGGAAIVAGNERVVRARLSDAKFFYETDLQSPLDSRVSKLESIVFHEKLGTQGDRVRRLEALAASLAPRVGADPARATLAARLAKADLSTEMVGEFPELQGLMGRRYALAQGAPADVAAAIEDHYRPQGPSDRTPSEPTSIAVALADKIDMLAGFWAIDEKPTGSKDPYALRRAALGVVRILLDNELSCPLTALFGEAFALRADLLPTPEARAARAADLIAFCIDRLKVHLRERGARHDLIEAAIGAGPARSDGAPQDDLVLIVQRVAALAKLLAAEDGASLLAGFRRAANILRIEEKKDGVGAYEAPPDPSRFVKPEEAALAAATQRCASAATAFIGKNDFEGAMRALAELRGPVDAFFEGVTVNDPDPAVRLNRLRLLDELRRATLGAADLSKIPG